MGMYRNSHIGDTDSSLELWPKRLLLAMSHKAMLGCSPCSKLVIINDHLQ